MIYLDNGATSMPKPACVARAMKWALENCANPGRGGHSWAANAAKTVYRCREQAAGMFDCRPEQVVFTGSCTQGLNMAIHTLVKPEARVVISGFEHNAVTRPLYAKKAKVTVAGRRLFDWDNTLSEFEKALRQGVDAAVFTHISNVFGYILPVEQLAQLCRQYGVPFAVDAAQSAGSADISLTKLGADYIAMPGHKGLLGPQGTGLLLCREIPEPLLFGGTGSDSRSQSMPDYLPEGAEAGTLNVPGIAGLCAALMHLEKTGVQSIMSREHEQLVRCVHGLRSLGVRVFAGEHQAATVSMLPPGDCEAFAQTMADAGIAVRAGLHCAPLAHESAGTADTGTVRISFGAQCSNGETDAFIRQLRKKIVNYYCQRSANPL